MQNKIVINFLGGPSAGKSTVACELYTCLKKDHIEAEYISEVAKEFVLEGNTSAIENQIYLFGCQLHKQQCAYKVAQVIISDSPLLLNAVYRPDDSDFLAPMVLEQHSKFNNLNILLLRGDAYSHSMTGRIHSLVESIGIDNKIKHLLKTSRTPFIEYDSFTQDINEIASIIKKRIA